MLTPEREREIRADIELLLNDKWFLRDELRIKVAEKHAPDLLNEVERLKKLLEEK
jgi:hypothetical protein